MSPGYVYRGTEFDAKPQSRYYMPADMTEATVHIYTAMEFEDRMTNERIDAYMKGRESVGA
ncbi:MAG: hypothetical protein M3536_02625 [Actinomycetota bacterium]|nr:hypothetical protein [Actinomycetota bacterium]